LPEIFNVPGEMQSCGLVCGSGELGGEGQGIIGDALRSINDWMLKNGHTTQLYFVVRDAATATSSGKFFEMERKLTTPSVSQSVNRCWRKYGTLNLRRHSTRCT
jgi:hypothetical protein